MTPAPRTLLALASVLAVTCERTESDSAVAASPEPSVETPAEPPTEAKAPSPAPDPPTVPAAQQAERLDEHLPGAHVVLPPKPTFPQVDFPAQYADGSYSISGLRGDLDAHVADGDRGVDVVVRATVQEVYRAPECSTPASCPPAKQPHAWLVDDEKDDGKRHAMMVVNYAFSIPEWDAKRWAGQPEVELVVGQTVRVRGRFRRFSDTGFAHDRGLLEFRAIETTAPDGTTSWIYPRGAPWHPLTKAR